MTMNRRLLAPLLASGLAVAPLVGCQTVNQTAVTVMNETASSVLVDVMRAGSEAVVFDAEELGPNASQRFAVDNTGAAVQVGVRPIEFSAAPAQWIEFPEGGPYLLRVQGSATDLRFVPSLDGTGDLEASGVQPIFTNRRFNEPPVTPSR
jgi:hypothetical protein